MAPMPRPRPPYLQREVSRHGTVRWYVRRGGGPRVRILAPYGSREFAAEYESAISGIVSGAPKKLRIGTLAWLVERYRDSSAWGRLSVATRRQRDNVLKHVMDRSGAASYADIDRRAIVDGIERRMASPAAARHFLDTMRGLLRWALETDHIDSDPTSGLKVAKPRSEGHHSWTPQEVKRFEAFWPIGTRERLAFDILLWTGLRRGDAVRIGRQHVSDGLISIKTEKTGELVVIPILPPLTVSIDACPPSGLSFIETDDGRPMAKESFGNWFRKTCDAAGLKGCSAHGLRKAAATKAAENGASVAQLEALFGWRGGGMASLYTRAVDRKKLGREAAEKMLKTGWK